MVLQRFSVIDGLNVLRFLKAYIDYVFEVGMLESCSTSIVYWKYAFLNFGVLIE